MFPCEPCVLFVLTNRSVSYQVTTSRGEKISVAYRSVLPTYFCLMYPHVDDVTFIQTNSHVPDMFILVRGDDYIWPEKLLLLEDVLNSGDFFSFYVYTYRLQE